MDAGGESYAQPDPFLTSLAADAVTNLFQWRATNGLLPYPHVWSKEDNWRQALQTVTLTLTLTLALTLTLTLTLSLSYVVHHILQDLLPASDVQCTPCLGIGSVGTPSSSHPKPKTLPNDCHADLGS